MKLLTTISNLPFSKYMADAGMAHLGVANADDTPAELTLVRCLSSVGKNAMIPGVLGKIDILLQAFLAKLIFYFRHY